ncbi:unnamed protein product [Rotaria sp. Silwood2]|nr:unnamed protein product [Rotaria sp. Silwood2]
MFVGQSDWTRPAATVTKSVVQKTATDSIVSVVKSVLIPLGVGPLHRPLPQLLRQLRQQQRQPQLQRRQQQQLQQQRQQPQQQLHRQHPRQLQQRP